MLSGFKDKEKKNRSNYIKSKFFVCSVFLFYFLYNTKFKTMSEKIIENFNLYLKKKVFSILVKKTKKQT